MGFVSAVIDANVALLRYSTQDDGAELSDLMLGSDLRRAIDKAEGLVIEDPMSFPWSFFVDDPPRCPVVVDLATCSTDDLVALLPVLGCLTNTDAILGDPSIVREVCASLDLDDLWMSPEEDVAAFARSAAWAKRADIEERSILSRLAEDPALHVVVLHGDDLRRTPDGFAGLAIELSEQLGGAIIDTVWGIHPIAGRPLDRVVLAFRSRERA